MRKASAVSVGVAVQCLVYSENILLVGCADGGLRLIPVRDGAYFSSNPTLYVRSFVRSLIVEATVQFLVLHLLVRDLIILALALFVSRWTAVNNKESPGISSISISYVRSTNDTVRCICCTGAEDGSVALFELKKISSR